MTFWEETPPIQRRRREFASSGTAFEIPPQNRQFQTRKYLPTKGYKVSLKISGRTGQPAFKTWGLPLLLNWTWTRTIFIQFSGASTPLDNGLLHPHHPGDTAHDNAILHLRYKSQRNIPTSTATGRGESRGHIRRGTRVEQGRRRQQDGQDVRDWYVDLSC